MNLSDEEKKDVLSYLERLTPSQFMRVRETMLAYGLPKNFWRLPSSDLVTAAVLENFGDRLVLHHTSSEQALSKDRFEFALNSALNESGVPSQLVGSRTNRGHDIDISGAPVSLKTEAASAIKEDLIHISKWMELGKGEWILTTLLDVFLHHMDGYSRIFTLRCLRRDKSSVKYELVEIPKSLMLESSGCRLEEKVNSTQDPKPGYGYVLDESDNLKYSLYFDGGTERKLQVKNLRKELCIVHATWEFQLPAKS